MINYILRIITAIFILFLLAGCVPAEQPVVKQRDQRFSSNLSLAGSGSNLPLVLKLIELYESKYNEKVELPPSIGSGGGIKAVSDGAIDLGLTSRPLLPEEVNSGLKQIPYARIAIVIAVNPDVQENNITQQEMVDIFAGKKSIWNDGRMIIVLSREEGDSSNIVLEDKLPGFKQVLGESLKERRWQVEYTDQDELNAIETMSGSIGFTDSGAMAVLKPKVKPLTFNGIAPTSVNVKNGSYLLYKDLYFVFKEPISDRASKFLSLVISDDGDRIIAENDAIPLKGK